MLGLSGADEENLLPQLGLISYVVKVAAGKRREIELLVWILTVLIHLRYVHLVAAKDICRP